MIMCLLAVKRKRVAPICKDVAALGTSVHGMKPMAKNIGNE